MYSDSPESRDVPAHERHRSPSPVRTSLAGGLVGGIGVMLVLIFTGVINIGKDRRLAASPALDTAISDTVAVQDTSVTTVDTVMAPAVLSTDTVMGTVEVETEPQPVYEPPFYTPPAAAPERTVAPPPPPPPPSLDERIRMHGDALQQAVLAADQAEIQAFRRLDPAPLYAAYTGSQLQTTVAAVQELREQGVHRDSRLVNIEWESFWVSQDERTARVEVTETWYTEYHDNETDECRLMVPTHQVPQRASLRRVSGAWKVESVEFTGSSPEPQACP